MRIKNAALAAIMAVSAHAAVPIARTIDVSATIKPIVLETYAGETLDLSMQLVAGGEALATPSASATIYWQTNGMANAWWQTNLACTASGMVTGLWVPSLPSGRVWFFVGVNSGGGLNYRIAGQCSILPSPGGTPSTAALPSPGGILNLADYTIIGAPWITSADSAAAIEAAGQTLDGKIRAVSNSIAVATQAAKDYTDYSVAQVASDLEGLAERSDAATSNLATQVTNLSGRVDSIIVPDVSGLAEKAALNAASNDLAEAVQKASSSLANASNALAQATAALSQTVAYNAQQAGYDLSAASNALAQATAALSQTVAYNAQQAGYDLAAASNALAQATAALAETVAANAQQAGYDLAAASNALAQATAALAETVAANAQQSGYDLAAVSNALAQATAALSVEMAELRSATGTQIISATNALNQSLAPTISYTSNVLAQATADLAQKVDDLAIATAASNTAYRLMSIDGQIYQDATGTVWRAAYATNPSPWHVTAVAYTNGATVATNEIPGIASWSIDGTYAGAEGDEWYWRLYFGGVQVSESAPGAAPSDMSTSFTLDGDPSGAYFARTNVVTRRWTPFNRVAYTNELSSAEPGNYAVVSNRAMNAVVVDPDTGGVAGRVSFGGGVDAFALSVGTTLTIGDWSDFHAVSTGQTLPEYLASLPPSGITTNDVCNIVTNEVPIGFTDWVAEPGDPSYTYDSVSVIQNGNGWDVVVFENSAVKDWFEFPNAGPDATRLDTPYFSVTRQIEGYRNALGLARLADLPPLTNGAVFYSTDMNGGKTALTIGTRKSVGSTMTIDTDTVPADAKSITASNGVSSSSMGVDNAALGYGSVASGTNTVASGQFSHSEGVGTAALAFGSHAEGNNTTAAGLYAHSEGVETRASGRGSHASGYRAVAGTSGGSVRSYTYVWQGGDTTNTPAYYYSHGHGTYNVNPVGGIKGFYIGEDSLETILSSIQPSKQDESLWVRPNDWVATAKVVAAPISSVDAIITTNDTTACIYSNSVNTIYFSLSADLGVDILDETVESAFECPIGDVTFSPVTGGIVTNNNRFIAESAGTWRIKATSPSNGVRYVDVPLTQIQSVQSNSTVYVGDADMEGKWRKQVNDAALSVMRDATLGGTGVVNGASYDVWWTTRCPARPISGHTVQGLRSRNAISPHLMVSARHYAGGADYVVIDGVKVHKDWNASYLTFHDPVGNTNVAVTTNGGMTGDTAYDVVPISPGYGFPLAMWAMTNGWTRAELAAMNIEDVMVHPIVSGLLPDECCPYFMSMDLWKSKFGGKGNVLGWAFSQTYIGRTAPDGILAGNYMTPCIIDIGNLAVATYAASTWTCAGYTWTDSVRADILARWNEMKNIGAAGSFPPIYGGDSSGGIYIVYDGKWVLCSQFKSIGGGPSFSAALPVLRALCAQYGDTLKEITE